MLKAIVLLALSPWLPCLLLENKYIFYVIFRIRLFYLLAYLNNDDAFVSVNLKSFPFLKFLVWRLLIGAFYGYFMSNVFFHLIYLPIMSLLFFFILHKHIPILVHLKGRNCTWRKKKNSGITYSGILFKEDMVKLTAETLRE